MAAAKDQDIRRSQVGQQTLREECLVHAAYRNNIAAMGNSEWPLWPCILSISY
jgi:hypothetical protein